MMKTLAVAAFVAWSALAARASSTSTSVATCGCTARTSMPISGALPSVATRWRSAARVAARVHVVRSCVDGAFYGSCDSGLGGEGGDGIRASQASCVLAAGSGAQRIRGGDFGLGEDPAGDEDGKSGDGVHLSAQSALRHSGVPVLPGVCLFDCGLAVQGGSALSPSPPDPTLERFALPDGTVGYRVFGAPGSTARLFVGTTPIVAPAPGSPVEALVRALHTFDLGTIPAIGSIERAVPELADLPGGPHGLVLAQAEVAFSAGDVRRTESVPLVRLATDCPEPGADCNDNGLDDDCEVALALAPDCNTNLVPDACDVASGAADVNANGIPDECESFAVLFVDDDAPGDPAPGDALVSDPLEDGSPQHPFDGISEAIAVAVDGDVVTILDGVYGGAENTSIANVNGREILIQSRNGPAACVIDLQGAASAAFVFRAQETPATIVDGLRFTNGAAAPAIVLTTDFSLIGTSPTIRNCVFHDNLDGAISAGDSDGRVVDCVFVDNERTDSQSAGAIDWIRGRPTIVGCTFLGNRATAGSSAGAVRLSQTDEGAFVDRCSFHGNRGRTGGALHVRASLDGDTFVEIRNCALSGNTARRGGGVYVLSYSQHPRFDTLLRGCTLTGNTAEIGGGVYFVGAAELAPSIENTILWGNVANTGSQIGFAPNAGFIVRAAFSDVEGGLASIGVPPGSQILDAGGNTNVDPGFRSDGVHLDPSSPLIDAGDPATVLHPDERDVDGDPRLTGSAIDVGADEQASSARSR